MEPDVNKKLMMRRKLYEETLPQWLIQLDAVVLRNNPNL